jgi:hypothetical protein
MFYSPGIVGDASLGRAGIAEGDDAFTPTSLAGLVLWLRADLANVTLNGADVSAWADQSGTGDANKHCVQAAAPSQPLYNAADADFGGMPSIGPFSGGETLDSALWAVPAAGPWAIGVVVKFADQLSTYDILDAFGANSTLIRASGVSLQTFMGTGVVGDVASATAKTLIVIEQNGASDKVYVNSATALATGDAGANQITKIRIGSNGGGGNAANGKIAEVFALSRAMVAGDWTSLAPYMLARYGITVAL